MSNDMVEISDLAYLPGAPFTQGEVDAAVAALRNAVDWHIAPEVEEQTVSFDISHCQARLLLPTRKLVSVDEVRVDGDVVDPDDYQVSALAQVVKRNGYWKVGFGTVEVDITHGYETVPPDLLPVIAETATSQRLLAVRAPVVENPAKVGEGVAGNVVLAAPLTERLLCRDVLERYSLRWLPGIA